MERNVKISLEKAREWYNSGNKALKEVALQIFTEKELMAKSWENIKTFADACRVLNINPYDVFLLHDEHLQNMYQLQIIKKALNGVDWKPNLNTGTIYYPWLRYYPKDISYDPKWVFVANFKAKEDNKIYTLISVDSLSYAGGLGYFGEGYGAVDTYHGLLGCKSKEIAEYFGKTFGKLIFDAIYGQYNNYIWLD